MALVQLEQLREAEHRVQRRAQLMAHARQEVALRAVRCLGRLARALGLGELQMLGDVFDRADDAPRPALRVAQQRHGRLHPHRVADLVDVALVAAIKRKRAGDQLRRELAVLRHVVGMREVGRRHRQQRFGAVPHQLAEARIGLLHVAAQVGVADADRHVVEDVAKALLALAHRRFGLLALAHLLRERGCALAHRDLDAACAAGHRQQQRAEHRH